MRPIRAVLFATALPLALAACEAESFPSPAAQEGHTHAATPAVAAGAAERPTAAEPASAHVGLMAHEPWSRPLAPGATVAAGYMHLMNHTSHAETLVSARAEGVGRIEIHSMAEVDGVMQMRPVEGGVPLAVDGMAAFQPGGKHLMFIDVTRSWAEGDTVPVTLGFASGTEAHVVFKVTATKGEGHEGGHAHH